MVIVGHPHHPPATPSLPASLPREGLMHAAAGPGHVLQVWSACLHVTCWCSMSCLTYSLCCMPFRLPIVPHLPASYNTLTPLGVMPLHLCLPKSDLSVEAALFPESDAIHMQCCGTGAEASLCSVERQGCGHISQVCTLDTLSTCNLRELYFLRCFALQPGSVPS